MSLEFYKVLHLAAIVALFCSLGLLIAQSYYRPQEKDGIRKFAITCHGLTLVLILITGFGMLARLGYMQNLPHWAWIKMGVWLVLGGYIVVIKRKPNLWSLHVPILVALGALAAYAVVLKP